MQKIAIPEEALKTDYVKYCNDTEILDLRILCFIVTTQSAKRFRKGRSFIISQLVANYKN